MKNVHRPNAHVDRPEGSPIDDAEQMRAELVRIASASDDLAVVARGVLRALDSLEAQQAGIAAEVRTRRLAIVDAAGIECIVGSVGPDAAELRVCWAASEEPGRSKHEHSAALYADDENGGAAGLVVNAGEEIVAWIDGGAVTDAAGGLTVEGRLMMESKRYASPDHHGHRLQLAERPHLQLTASDGLTLRGAGGIVGRGVVRHVFSGGE